MIVPMKKVSVLLYHKEKESFLNDLQDLGVMHIVIDSEKKSDNLDLLSGKVKKAGTVLKALKKLEKESKAVFTQAKGGNAEELIEQYYSLESDIEKMNQQRIALQKDLSILEPWGDFDPNHVDRLNNSGVKVRFFEVAARKFESLPLQDFYYSIINKNSSIFRIIVFEKDEVVALDAEEVLLPATSLSKIRFEIKELDESIDSLKASLIKLIPFQKVIADDLAEDTMNHSFESARINMEETAEGKLLVFSGWIPAKIEKKVSTFLDGFSLWYQINKPLPSESIPVLMKNNAFSTFFEPITKVFALPDYFEIDPTPFFAPFYALFFGLCLGDVGYGSIILIISIIATTKLKGGQKIIPMLGIVLGVSTIIAGGFLNTFFGEPLFVIEGSKGGMTTIASGIAFLNPVETEKGMYFPAMPFAMYVGLFQIMLGIFLRSVNKLLNYGISYMFAPLAEIFLVCAATIFLAKINFVNMADLQIGVVPVGSLLFSIPYSIIGIIGAIGAVLLLIFVKPEDKVFSGSLAQLPLRLLIRFGLWFLALYNFITGLMSNSLSYLRLFALGLAGGLLGAAFNQMGLMIITGENGVNWTSPVVVFTILIIILGHILNFGLGALGSYVHSLRLTFVEFYGCLEFKGGSKPYKPFKKR